MTIKELLIKKYKHQEKRAEKLELIKTKIKVSDSHFYKKINGQSPLSLSQAKAAAEVLKVPVSKLTILVLLVGLCLGCDNPTPPTKEAKKEALELQAKQHFIFY